MAPLEPGLLDSARSAAVKVIEAEKQLQIAKAEYHAEVRRLHLAGASLREIAAALAISHQRVQQIVDEAGGSWWTKVWRNRTTSLQDTECSFCHRSRAQVAKLISGPDVFICDACIARAEKAANQGTAAGGFAVAPKTDRTRCSFCGQRQGTKAGITRTLVSGAGRGVCSDCLGLCRRIVDETT